MAVAPFSLEGKVAIVTGGDQGLGRAIGLALAEAGADVAVASASPGEARAVAEVAQAVRDQGRRALAFSLELSRSQEVEAMVGRVVAELGRVDVLVNGVEVALGKPFVDITDAEWSQVLAANVTAAFVCSRAAARPMLQQGKGRIINLVSGLSLRGMPNMAAYCASQGALVQLARALALEWARSGIRVNALGYGWVEGSPLTPQDETMRGSLVRYLPLRRLAQPEEVAVLAVYLASDASEYVTGQTLFADGGALAHG